MTHSITTIKFKIGNKEIEMTAEEAREIYGQLKLLFVQANETPFFIPTAVPTHSQPIYWEYQSWPEPYKITCSSDANAVFCVSS
jgi:hypothetical protein